MRQIAPSARIRRIVLEQVFFDLSELDDVVAAFNNQGADPGKWAVLRHHCLRLPEWFDSGLDPMSASYKNQQVRLWREIAAVGEAEYDAETYEPADIGGYKDVVLFPGRYSDRSPTSIRSAGDHFIALGQIMKQGGIAPYDRVLEYGAGFGQIAITLGRFGVVVDTVDINQQFCDSIKQQAALFQVDVRPHRGLFGYSPDGVLYDAIIFYESFHHCIEFIELVGQLKGKLKPNGRILLAGEPIKTGKTAALPYGWGLRLDAETLSVVRLRKWFELGFQHDFLVDLFVGSGFLAQVFECDISIYGEIRMLTLHPDVLEFSSLVMPPKHDASWHNREPAGRWSRGRSSMPLDMSDNFQSIRLSVVNHHPHEMNLRVDYGPESSLHKIRPRSEAEIMVDARVKSPTMEFTTSAVAPSTYGFPDTRELGLFFKRLAYAS